MAEIIYWQRVMMVDKHFYKEHFLCGYGNLTQILAI